MIIRFLFLLLALPVLGFSQLIEVDRFGSNPGHLRMFVHEPVQASTESMPLVVVLHGCSQDAKSIAALTGWNKLADSLGFYLLFPQTRIYNNPSKCFSWFSPNHNRAGQGEARSIRSQINYMTLTYQIDPTQIHIYGVSAGAAMAVTMCAVYPELFSAGVSMAGGPYGGANDVWESAKLMVGEVNKAPEDWAKVVQDQNPDFSGSYPRMIISHGANDPVVNVKNADELIEQWTALHGLSIKPSSEDHSFQDQDRISRFEYGRDGKEVVVDYRVQDLGHRLLIDPGKALTQGGKKGVFGLDIDFHSTYWIAKDLGLMK